MIGLYCYTHVSILFDERLDYRASSMTLTWLHGCFIHH